MTLLQKVPPNPTRRLCLSEPINRIYNQEEAEHTPYNTRRIPYACLLTDLTAVNGREKVICVRNMDVNQIQKKAELLRDASGKKLKKPKVKVESINPSVRGIWSPLHVRDTKV